jgi:hypothetical protein
MGGVRFTPDFDDMGAPQEQWYELSGGSGKGKVMIALAYQPSTVSPAFVYFAHTLFVCFFSSSFHLILPSSCLHSIPLFLGDGFSDARRPGLAWTLGKSSHDCATPGILIPFYGIPVCSLC